MTTRKMMFALLTTTAARAFAPGDKPGWKMDGDKLALDSAGNPIYVDTTGTESAVQGDTISRLNNEAKGHRTAKETAETALNAYKDETGKLIDPTIAIKAVKTVAGLDAKKLIDAGELDKVRETVKSEFMGQLSEKDKALNEMGGRLDNMTIDRVFSGSDFIRDRVAMPRDFFEAAMRSNFKVNDGKVEAYDRSGNRIMSRKTIGEYADPAEALEIMVDTHPQKDTILKAAQSGGTGTDSNGGSRGKGRVVSRSDFDAMSPGDKAAAGTAMQKGEMTITD